MVTATLDAPTLQTGWFPGLSLAEYLAIPAMSASGLESFRRSPAHYQEERRHPKEPTAAMQEGTALHLALLEPDLFAGRYISLGRCEASKKDGTPCTNPAIVLRAEAFGSGLLNGEHFCGVHDPEKGTPMHTGVHVMPAEAMARIEGMKRAVLAHPEAAQFFRGRGSSELSGIWVDPDSGVICKLRLDRFIERAGIYFDLKRVSDASVEGFRKQVVRMGYARRAQFYRRGMEQLGKPGIGSVLCAAEADAPHGVQTFLLDEADLSAFDPEISRLLYQFAECQETGEWPAYPSGLRHLKLPAYGLPNTDFHEIEDSDD